MAGFGYTGDTGSVRGWSCSAQTSQVRKRNNRGSNIGRESMRDR